MNNVKTIVLGFVLLTFADIALAVEESVESVDSRPGVKQPFVLTTPSRPPVASVILFAGGHGALGLSSVFGSPTFGWGKNNFVVRTRERYARHGFSVATIDAPSDRKKMNAKWRMGKKHADDVAAVVNYLNHQANAPVWIVGTSMGSFSAANIAIRLANRIDGVVLTSSVTRSRPGWSTFRDHPNGILNMNLDRVTDPVFVVSHKDDQCRVTPPADIQRLANSFSRSKRVESRLFSGGAAPISDPCQALSRHGFLGIESEVVDAIAAFITAN